MKSTKKMFLLFTVAFSFLLFMGSSGCVSSFKEICYEWCEPDPDPPDPGDIDPSWTYCPWDRNVTEWPVTIPLKSASLHYVGGHDPWEVRVDYDVLQNLPKWYQNPDPKNLNSHNVNGSIWLIRDFRGTMYIGTIDYLRVNQRSKRFALAPNYLIEYKPGEKVGVMVSTTARQWDGTRVDGDPNAPYRQRSNVTWTKWPATTAVSENVRTRHAKSQDKELNLNDVDGWPRASFETSGDPK